LTKYELLIKILPEYYNYIISNKNTLIERIFGCYSVVVNGITIYILVTENPFFRFDANVDSVYYLNGKYHSDNLSTNDNTINTMETSAENWTGKREYTDQHLRKNDDTNINFEFPFKGIDSGNNNNNFLGQMEADTMFLANLNLYNYRLLCGISSHNGEFGPMEKAFYLRDRRTKRPNLFYDRKNICFFTIVNILNEFSIQKKMERIMLSMLCFRRDGNEEESYMDTNWNHSYQSRFLSSMKIYFRSDIQNSPFYDLSDKVIVY
jgi:hypothetical protein